MGAEPWIENTTKRESHRLCIPCLCSGGLWLFWRPYLSDACRRREHLLTHRRAQHHQGQALADKLGLTSAQGGIDACAPHLAELNVRTRIHSAGPFQSQDYSVVSAAIAASANYIDLADGRDFVAGIEQLSTMTCELGVFVASEASSLSALSSAVVDRYLGRFRRLETIRHGIGSGAPPRSGDDARHIRLMRHALFAAEGRALGKGLWLA